MNPAGLASKSRFKQGLYVPKNPDKYIGDVTKIVYRSSYELETNQFFDNNPKVVRWGSEIVAIPYLKPTDGRIHKYYPDYYVEYINADGKLIKELIEVKPSGQTKRPHGNRKHALYEQVTYAINVAKWQACQDWCKQHGMVFRIITERKIFK